MLSRILFIASFIIVISISDCFAQVLGFALTGGKKKVKIPIEIHNNLIVIPVVLNGALPLKFILDTGVRTAILTQKSFTDILNVSYSRKYVISGPGGRKLVDAYVANNISLDLPGIHGRGHALLVLEEDYLELRNYLGTDVHGILGYELFSRFIIQIDYEKKMLTIMLPEKFKGEKKYQTIPIRVEDTKPYITTPVGLNGTTQLTGKLLVDSGASHGLLLEPTSDERIRPPAAYISSAIGRGLGGEIIGKVGRIESLTLGNYRLENVIARFPDANSYFDSLKLGNTSRNGAIGGEVLSRFTVIFNFPKEEMYLKKNSSFKRGFHYNLSGLTMKAIGSTLDVFEITDVQSKSVSDEAGIMEGDIVVSINGISTRTLDLNVINGFFNYKVGKRIKLEINRNGQILKKEFKLRDQI